MTEPPDQPTATTTKWLTSALFIAVGTGCAVLATVLIIEIANSSKRNAMRMEVFTRLRGIYSGYQLYVEQNRGLYSPDLGTLYQNNYFTADFVLSPFTNKRAPANFESWDVARQNRWINTQSSFVIAPQWMREKEGIVVYLKPEDSDGHGVAIAWSDNHCGWKPIDSIRELIESNDGRPMPRGNAKEQEPPPPG